MFTNVPVAATDRVTWAGAVYEVDGPQLARARLGVVVVLAGEESKGHLLEIASAHRGDNAADVGRVHVQGRHVDDEAALIHRQRHRAAASRGHRDAVVVEQELDDGLLRQRAIEGAALDDLAVCGGIEYGGVAAQADRAVGLLADLPAGVGGATL
jgi:hypothetical protein